jgi:hypothetical protein
MTDAVAYYLVTYQVKASKKFRTRTFLTDGDLHSLANQPGLRICSVKVVTPALPGEGLSWLTRVKTFFKRIK